MEDLVGKEFNLDNVSYAIVDVRNIQGDTMVYAEPTATPAGPGRAAFRYVDIEKSLDSSTGEVA